jgi:transposase
MSVSDLCREFGVSRQTGYRWINRYKEVGPEGLLNRSSKPNGYFHATTEAIENEIFALRSKHPSWGARKLKARLEMLDPEVNWPAASTFGNILRRAGLTSPKRRKRRTTPYSEPFSEVTAPNQLWCMDFKGYFNTGDGMRCDPFTITDAIADSQLPDCRFRISIAAKSLLTSHTSVGDIPTLLGDLDGRAQTVQT